ncbi:MAG TPA: hypothetical protein DIW81_00400 [Planctomycetaceae bacterium]|nr:hypothetical protein [Rubinisphaera sp.]HCS50045.1 hypothetical protein [Planctomycetaceae bacterium]
MFVTLVIDQREVTHYAFPCSQANTFFNHRICRGWFHFDACSDSSWQAQSATDSKVDLRSECGKSRTL